MTAKSADLILRHFFPINIHLLHYCDTDVRMCVMWSLHPCHLEYALTFKPLRFLFCQVLMGL